MELTERQPFSKTVSCSTETIISVGSVVRNSIGKRTITQFCEDSGLSVGYVSRLLNGKLKSTPSVRTLAKISCSSVGKDKEKVFSNLLELCGYDLDSEDFRREIYIVERASEIIADERSGVKQGKSSALSFNAGALGLIFSYFMKIGVSLQPLGYLKPYEGLEFKIKDYPFERVIAIPGFCADNDQQVVLAERNILQQLLKFVSGQKDVPLYLVLANHQDVFDYVSDVAEKFVAGSVYVLLANREHTRFIGQKFFAADGMSEEAPFAFVDDTNCKKERNADGEKTK